MHSGVDTAVSQCVGRIVLLGCEILPPFSYCDTTHRPRRLVCSNAFEWIPSVFRCQCLTQRCSECNFYKVHRVRLSDTEMLGMKDVCRTNNQQNTDLRWTFACPHGLQRAKGQMTREGCPSGWYCVSGNSCIYCGCIYNCIYISLAFVSFFFVCVSLLVYIFFFSRCIMAGIQQSRYSK